MASVIEKAKELVRKLKVEIVPIYYSLFDKRTPILAKAIAVITIGYLLSPIDLIPDFIPILGLLDDLIIVPLLIKLTLKLIPQYIIEDIKTKIDSQKMPSKKWYFALPIIIIYIGLAWMLYSYFKNSIVA